uniref:Uncharacterized protein n=1 Tax=uncultured marine virus TaxID=186617 RepID=A0A0F7L3B8_9VIRU|nr:hypothetical protein [uncultured marine virus]
MAKTLSTLRSELRTELKIDNQKNIWTDATLTSYINEAILQVQTEGNLDWAENVGGSQTDTVVAGTDSYAYATDLGRIEVVKLGDNVLTQESKAALVRKYDITKTGTPSSYYIEGANLKLFPVPTAGGTLTTTYRKRLPLLSADADLLAFPDDFAPALVHYAAFKSWVGYSGGASGNAQMEFQAYEGAMNIVKSVYLVFSQADFKFGTTYN